MLCNPVTWSVSEVAILYCPIQVADQWQIQGGLLGPWTRLFTQAECIFRHTGLTKLMQLQNQNFPGIKVACVCSKCSA